MPCPFLHSRHPARCGAVASPVSPPQLVMATLCRKGFQACPAYRFTQAAGKLLHPADFWSWVVLGIPPGCNRPPAEPLAHPG